MPQATINEILAKFDIRDADIKRIRGAAPVLKREMDAFIADFYTWMAQHREYQTFFASNPSRLERVKQLQRLRQLLTLLCGDGQLSGGRRR